VGALGHYLERGGIATTSISLVRPHTERVRPPRALWVPYELGRPLGPPGDAALQRRILLFALRLLEREEGPPVLEDFPEEDQGQDGDPGWQPPALPPGASLAAEVEALRPLHERARAARGRTTVGLSGRPLGDAVEFLERAAAGERPGSPRRDLAELLFLRFAADDLKAFYQEAADADGGHPSSAQIAGWLWGTTRLAAILRAVRSLCLAGDDETRQHVGGKMLIPAEWV
jgi:hypothetical protein